MRNIRTSNKDVERCEENEAEISVRFRFRLLVYLDTFTQSYVLPGLLLSH